MSKAGYPCHGTPEASFWICAISRTPPGCQATFLSRGLPPDGTYPLPFPPVCRNVPEVHRTSVCRYILFPYQSFFELNIHPIFQFWGQHLPFLVEERFHFGGLVVSPSVNHVIGDILLLAVTCQRAFGDTEQLAKVIVIQKCVAFQTLFQLVHPLQGTVDPIKPFHDLHEHYLDTFAVYL